MNAAAIPLRIAPQRFWAWAGALCVISLVPIWNVPSLGFLDWSNFRIAGTVVGTAALFDPSHGTFPYLPGSAWGLVPFAHLPPFASFAASRICMLVLLAAAGIVAARVFGFSRRFTVMLAFAWAPCMSAVLIGQNATAALLLVMLALRGLQTSSLALTALPIGLLLYKPTYALPLIGLLALRGLRRELAVVAAVAAAWYVASIPAAGGNVLWPAAWAHYLASTLGTDYAINITKTISMPGLLMHAGVQPSVAAAAGLLAALVCIPYLRRAPLVEAGCAACLVGLAASPHAWGYDAVLAFPMICVAVTRLPEPHRTRLLCAAFAVAPFSLFSPLLGFNPLAPLVIGGVALWAWARRGAPQRAAAPVPERRAA